MSVLDKCARASGGPHIEPQYRQYPQLTKKQKLESELLSGAMWFWILWHCWHDPDAIMVCKHGQGLSISPICAEHDPLLQVT